METMAELVKTLRDLHQEQVTRAAWLRGRDVPEGIQANACADVYGKVIVLVEELAQVMAR